MKQKTIYGFKLGIMVLVPIGIFYYLFTQQSLTAVFQEIRQVNIFIFFTTLIISVGNNVLITALRWTTILRKIGYDLPYRKILFIKMGSEPFVGFLPAKSGELSRAVYLQKRESVNFDDALFSIGIGYVLNFLVLISCTLAGGLYFYSGAIMPLESQAKWIFSVCLRPQRFFDNNRWFNRILAWADQKFTFRKYLCNTMDVLLDWRILLLSVMIWVGEIFNFYLLSIGLGDKLPFLLVCWVLPAVIVVCHLPITIAGLGVREGLVFIWLANYAPPEHLLSLGLLYSFVEQIFPIMVGGLATGHFVGKILSKAY